MYERPFVTPRFVAHAGDTRLRRLSLAVALTDDFTGLAPAGGFRVLLRERRDRHARGQEPVRNPSGYYCFVDVPAGTYTLVAEPDPGARFYWLRPGPGDPWPAGFERAVTLPLADPRAPVVRLTLTPDPAYPFPPHATLVRGRVRRAGNPVAGAAVQAEYRRTDPADPDRTVRETASTRTDARGNYVLFFLAPDPPRQAVRVEARAGGGAPGDAPAVLEEGRAVTRIDVTLP